MSPRGTLERALEEARRELGTEESPRGSNRQEFSAALGRPPEPWCADFLAVVMRRAGVRIPSESAYTPTMAAGFQRAGRWTTRPQVGAVAFYRWRVGRTVRIAHVGIVERVNRDGSIVAIEGNTDSAGGRTGGRVMRQVRRANIVGYGLPVYAAPTTAEDDDVEFIGPGSNPNSVRVVQEALLAEAKQNGQPNPLPAFGADGDYGDETRGAVEAYQRRRGIHTSRPGMAGGATLFFLGPYRTPFAA